MKSFNKVFAAAVIAIAAAFAAANFFIGGIRSDGEGRPYRVEAERLARRIEESGFRETDLTGCQYVYNIEKFGDAFFDTNNDCIIREINGVLYRFDYSYEETGIKNKILLAVNIILSAAAAGVILLLLYARRRLLTPFERLSELPYELSKGNLTAPLKENKNRFFGKFIWGMDMLRENIEERKKRELMLQKEKKTLLLSFSHDIKTPLSAIKLYSAAIGKNLYSDADKQKEIAESISRNADEIEKYLSKIISASREDFLSLEINNSEFYLSELMGNILSCYGEKSALLKTDFRISEYENCLLKGDLDRGAEALQNIIENALKYGDGERVELTFSDEDGCKIITVKNSGCTLPDGELPHIFESFWRGSNAERVQGSGLGLYICRQLMNKMNGEVFAEIRNGEMWVSAVFAMA